MRGQLGLGVIVVGRLWDWPDQPSTSFVTAHLAPALLYSGLLDLTIVLSRATERGGIITTLAAVRPRIFWQTIEGMLVYGAVIGMTWASRAADRGREQAAQVARADTLRVRVELDGLTVLARLPYQPSVIFTTAFDTHAVQAFELGAMDDLLKPFGLDRFELAVTRVNACGDSGR